MVGEALAADGPLVEPEGLDLRAHRAVEHQNPLGEQRFEQVGLIDNGGLASCEQSVVSCQSSVVSCRRLLRD